MRKIYNRMLTFLKFKELFFQLVARNIKLKYRKSILGYFWSVLNPLLSMVVLTIVFSNLFGRGIQYFPIYVVVGHMLFGFMNAATTRSLSSIIGNAGILKKVYVPKYIFTLSAVSSELIFFIFSLGALIIVILVVGAPLTWRFILIFIPIIELYVFCIGMGLFLAQAMVFFRDVQHLWSVFTTAWMYLSAIFYPISIMPDFLQHIVTRYNPMYFYITAFRDFILGSDNAGSMDFVVRGAVAAVIMLLIGYVSFANNKKKFILYI